MKKFFDENHNFFMIFLLIFVVGFGIWVRNLQPNEGISMGEKKDPSALRAVVPEVKPDKDIPEVNTQDSQAIASKININTADGPRLQLLPGIGEKLSESILLYRQENGAFSSIDDIKNVPHIGDKIFTKIQGNITIE